MYWKRSSGQPKYLHLCHYLEKEEGDEWEGQIAGLIKKVAQTGANDPAVITNLQEKVDSILEILTVATRDTKFKHDEQKKRFDSIQSILQQKYLKKL